MKWQEIAGLLAQSEAFKIKTFNIWEPFELTLKNIIRVQDKGCTLIARSIDSLTEDEKKRYRSLCFLDKAGSVHVVSFRAGLYLISCGILPPNVSSEGVEFTDA